MEMDSRFLGAVLTCMHDNDDSNENDGENSSNHNVTSVQHAH